MGRNKMTSSTPIFLQLACLLVVFHNARADVVLGTCLESSESLVEVTSLSFNPYPVVLSGYINSGVDVSFSINVKEDIPDDAIFEVTVERIGFYGNIPLPCIDSVQDIIDGFQNMTLPPPATTTTEMMIDPSASPPTLLPDVDLACHFDMSEVFAWNNGGLCTALGQDCSDILKAGPHNATVHMPIPTWLKVANLNGALDPYLAGFYVLKISVIDLNEKILGCSSVEFEISDPKATTTTTQEPDPEDNVDLETCGDSTDSSVVVDSVLISPYPIILHSFMSYDVSFAFNVTSKIPDDAIISVAVEGMTDDNPVPIPCFTGPEMYESLNDTCDFSLTDLFAWDEGALCKEFDDGCSELQEVGNHAGKVRMDVPLVLGSLIAAADLDAFIAGTYKLSISILNTDGEILGCAAVSVEFFTPTTITTTTTTTEGPEPGSDAVMQTSSFLFIISCLYSYLYL